MGERRETEDPDLDAVLAALTARAARNAPRPDPGLVERVLADAATVAAGREADRARTPRAAGDVAPARPGFWDRLFGLPAAAAALAACLAIGVGIGYGFDEAAGPPGLGLLAGAEADPLLLLFDTGTVL